jgi:hypothetical protein
MTEIVTIVSKLPMSLNMQLQTETVETFRSGPNQWQEPVSLHRQELRAPRHFRAERSDTGALRDAAACRR